jgi:putative hydrolase of the HAD superfamily
MKKATGIKIISIDLFRTIVDIDQTPDMIYQLFLKDNYSAETAEKYKKKAVEIMDRTWEISCTDDKVFKNIRTILEDTVTELFGELKLNYDTKQAAFALMADHSLKTIFPDAKPFLEQAGQKYTVCLSTDCDVEMIENVDKIYPFNTLFVSETLKMYKLNPAFFQHVIKCYNVKPENILHIGDSKSDIIAPKQLGIRTCWLNRRNIKWDSPVKPDFEVNSLLEIPELLD